MKHWLSFGCPDVWGRLALWTFACVVSSATVMLWWPLAFVPFSALVLRSLAYAKRLRL